MFEKKQRVLCHWLLDWNTWNYLVFISVPVFWGLLPFAPALLGYKTHRKHLFLAARHIYGLRDILISFVTKKRSLPFVHQFNIFSLFYETAPTKVFPPSSFVFLLFQHICVKKRERTQFVRTHVSGLPSRLFGREWEKVKNKRDRRSCIQNQRRRKLKDAISHRLALDRVCFIGPECKKKWMNAVSLRKSERPLLCSSLNGAGNHEKTN